MVKNIYKAQAANAAKQCYKLGGLLSFIIMISSSSYLIAQKVQLCDDNRQFYSKFFGSNDTIAFITKELFDTTPGLYGMSAAVNDNEIDCKVVEFKFLLIRRSQILYSYSYDTFTLKTLDSLRSSIKKYEIKQGDILIFTDIKVKHPYIGKSYCYHQSIPMIRVIDNYKTYPRRMYMDVDKYLDNKNK